MVFDTFSKNGGLNISFWVDFLRKIRCSLQKTSYFTMQIDPKRYVGSIPIHCIIFFKNHRKIRCFLKRACENHRILRWFWGNLTQKWTQDGVKMVLRWRYVGSCWRSWALSWLILALLGSILSRSCRKMAPRWPNIAPKKRAKTPTQRRAERSEARPPSTQAQRTLLKDMSERTKRSSPNV